MSGATQGELMTILGLLTKIGGFKVCNSTHQNGLTVAGMLMFGREDKLREALPRYAIDYREKLSNDPNIRWTDRITSDGTWHNNLFQSYMRIIQRLFYDLKLPFQMDSELFRTEDTPVHQAIRETFVNALIHADYQGQGAFNSIS